MEQQTPQPTSNQSSIMRWISFGVINILFVIAVIRNILSGKETDVTLAAVFLVVTGFAWGANLWKYFARKLP